MRKRQTFLLTILSTENEAASFCGQLKVISSGKTSNFTSVEELNRLIASEMNEEELRALTVKILSPNGGEKKLEE